MPMSGSPLGTRRLCRSVCTQRQVCRPRNTAYTATPTFQRFYAAFTSLCSWYASCGVNSTYLPLTSSTPQYEKEKKEKSLRKPGPAACIKERSPN
eukprot:193134-Pelagomonas_calceolata.AAC.2